MCQSIQSRTPLQNRSQVATKISVQHVTTSQLVKYSIIRMRALTKYRKSVHHISSPLSLVMVRRKSIMWRISTYDWRLWWWCHWNVHMLGMCHWLWLLHCFWHWLWKWNKWRIWFRWLRTVRNVWIRRCFSVHSVVDVVHMPFPQSLVI